MAKKNTLLPIVALLLVVLVFVVGCSKPFIETKSEKKDVDPHSASKPMDAVVTHEHLNLLIDFEKEEIRGEAILQIWNHTGADSLYLDTRNLIIEKIFLGSSSQEILFNLDSEKPFLGQTLEIPIGHEEKQTVRVFYHTTTGADALQWLKPEQTAGKKAPFLFTQGQAILSRTWFPCQDSPGIRFTWSADVVVKSGLKVVMSGDKQSVDPAKGSFHFEMSHPVPAYLVALSAGNIAYKNITKNTAVYAEPEMLDAAAYEFENVGKMVDVAEQLYGKYKWGRYDILVLPPSFPFGGMENPCLTFATPTILAGDRSLVSLIAHELSHSWSGNLVTNATWDDFWLNEGFTVYFERRIMESLEGKEYSEMLALLGYQDLVATLEELEADSSATCLKLNLKGKDPDEGMTDIAYEKGYLLLCSLEKQVGREKWDAFLKKYFEDFAFQTISSEGFIEYLNKNLLSVNNISVEASGVNEWIYKPGLPKGTKVPTSVRFEKVDELALQFLKSGKLTWAPEEKWSSHEWLHYLRAMPGNLTLAQMESLDKEFEFSKSGNSEILFEWLKMSIQHNYLDSFDELEYFLIHTGRRKFVLPLFKELMKTIEGKDLALKIYKKAKRNYHSVTRQSVEALFKE